MIIIKLMGGLGNQLFQYAYGRALALERGDALYLDTKWYRGRLNRKYLLDNFNIQAKKAGLLLSVFNKKDVQADPLGNWHEEAYFKKYSDIIKKEISLKKPFSLKNQDTLEKIESSNSVSIHIRGGDYVRGEKSAFHGTCTPEYYTEAIKIIFQKIPDPHFYIFTDDLPWAKSLISFPEPYTLVSEAESDPEEELMLMSACKHNIIANSTFSWWAAWLNKNQEKIIIAPKKWFTDEKKDTSGILPASWIRI